MKRCKTCKFFKPEKELYGECGSEKFDYNHFGGHYGLAPTEENSDMLLCMDSEDHFAYVQVGANFGCVHHQDSG